DRSAHAPSPSVEVATHHRRRLQVGGNHTALWAALKGPSSLGLPFSYVCESPLPGFSGFGGWHATPSCRRCLGGCPPSGRRSQPVSCLLQQPRRLRCCWRL